MYAAVASTKFPQSGTQTTNIKKNTHKGGFENKMIKFKNQRTISVNATVTQDLTGATMPTRDWQDARSTEPVR